MRRSSWQKAKLLGKEELCEMIEEINETQVEEEEVLSNRAYYYECDTGKLLF